MLGFLLTMIVQNERGGLEQLAVLIQEYKSPSTTIS
jgi:hypothetical protein